MLRNGVLFERHFNIPSSSSAAGREQGAVGRPGASERAEVRRGHGLQVQRRRGPQRRAAQPRVQRDLVGMRPRRPPENNRGVEPDRETGVKIVGGRCCGARVRPGPAGRAQTSPSGSKP